MKLNRRPAKQAPYRKEMLMKDILDDEKLHREIFRDLLYFALMCGETNSTVGPWSLQLRKNEALLFFRGRLLLHKQMNLEEE